MIFRHTAFLRKRGEIAATVGTTIRHPGLPGIHTVLGAFPELASSPRQYPASSTVQVDVDSIWKNAKRLSEPVMRVMQMMNG